jgi:antitoxin component YwqK of YwqJK toxin-antitoxin module
MKNFKFNGKKYGLFVENNSDFDCLGLFWRSKKRGNNISIYKNGKKHGFCISAYYIPCNGNIYKKCYYENGLLNGECIYYYENNNIKKKCYYKNDKIEGEFIEYYESGNIKRKMNYKNDLLNGECIYYYDINNYNIEKVCYYFNGGLLEIISYE